MQNLLCKLFSQWFNLFPAKSLEAWELDNAFKEQDCFLLALLFLHSTLNFSITFLH